MQFKQARVNGTFEHPAHWKICHSNILHIGQWSVFSWLLSSCECHSPAIVFHPCSVMGTGEQWSVDTVRQVKALMSFGLPLPRIATQTGVVLQTLRSISARLKKGCIGEKHSNHRGAHTMQTDEMKRWVSDHLLAKPKASVSEVYFEFRRSGFDLSRSTLCRIMRSQHRPVRPIRTHKVRMVNCKRRVDFCVDLLRRLHRFDQLVTLPFPQVSTYSGYSDRIHNCFALNPLEFEVCTENVHSGFRVHSKFPTSQRRQFSLRRSSSSPENWWLNRQ